MGEEVFFHSDGLMGVYRTRLVPAIQLTKLKDAAKRTLAARLRHKDAKVSNSPSTIFCLLSSMSM